MFRRMLKAMTALSINTNNKFNIVVIEVLFFRLSGDEWERNKYFVHYRSPKTMNLKNT